MTTSTDVDSIPRELVVAVTRLIAGSALVVLVQRRIPDAESIASELGNNCAQGVLLIFEAFLEQERAGAATPREPSYDRDGLQRDGAHVLDVVSSGGTQECSICGRLGTHDWEELTSDERLAHEADSAITGA